ncbi:AraC family transcriptional regulator [Methylovirgula sp. 4M-Z18]|uniref:AraC family transcriptional regulator n=1 Tax=Methylovirgula sp. 4M-Z18 TaxID=2293567 RepID=UPI00131472C2|nr:helix-turn-helix domain-containing protein [Methylovirgula sp. 4M-Z18]
MAQAIRGTMSWTNGPHPLGRAAKNFHASLAGAVFDGLSIAIGKFTVAISQSGVTANGHTFMFAIEPGTVRRVSGRDLFGDHIFHLRPNARMVTSSPTGWPWASGVISMSFDLLAARGLELAGVEHVASLDDDRMFLVPETAMAKLVGLTHDISRIIRETPWIIAAPQSAKALSGALLDTLLFCLLHSRLKLDRAALGRHRQIVARFERALEERPEDMLSVGDICAAVGVAERTLNLACQEFLGESAMQYARKRRLDRVRERLLASDPAATLVTGVAMQYGFWELGRFAQAYRVRFGERPSETLQRKTPSQLSTKVPLRAGMASSASQRRSAGLAGSDLEA